MSTSPITVPETPRQFVSTPPVPRLTITAPPVPRDHTFIATVRADCTDTVTASDVMRYLGSPTFRSVVATQWANEMAPGYGIALASGPRPVFVDQDGKETSQRTDRVAAYTVDMRLTKSI